MSNSEKTVTVRLSHCSYDIQISSGMIGQVGQLVTRVIDPSHCAVITDQTVESMYGKRVAEELRKSGLRVDLFSVAPGEPSKSVDTAHRLWDWLLATGSDRRTTIVAVGGGVVGDLAGFVSASFARGLPLVQFPTTLLAQVDSSVGGKVGINLTGAKNMVGAFWQPSVVLIDTDTLSTLTDREYRAGLAEVVKYGVILDADFFAYLEKNVDAINEREETVLATIIAKCCQLKADVVQADERELTGHRAVLNYGHTFAHAFEAVAGYGELLHGEAVSIGMLCASRLAELLHRIPPETTQRQYELLSRLHLPVSVPELDFSRLLAAMHHDKKVEHGRLRFILPASLGHVEFVGDVDTAMVKQAMLAQC